MNLNKSVLNNVYNRFLPITESAAKCFEPEPKITDFEFIKQVGIGTFGRVFLVSHKITKVKYAIKAIDKKIKINIKEKNYFRREVEIMYRINHPNIVKLYGHFEDNDYCYFIMEYIPNGNIYSLIPKHGRKKQSNRIIASIIKDVINAVYYLHNMNPPIIHRDIKPENILLNDNNKAVLTDFGWSNYLNDNEQRKSICGTPIYLAPEMINRKGHDGHIDIWCIGVLLFELVTGRIPFQGNNIETLKYNIRNMNIDWPSDINYEVKDLISKILKYNPKDRLTAEGILNHIFIKKYFPKAVNKLIIPNNNLKNKIFVISVDDPKNWEPFLNEEEPEKEQNVYQYYNTEKKIIKKYNNNTNKIFFSNIISLTLHNFEKKNPVINYENNYNSNTFNNYKYHKKIKNNQKINYENNKSFNSYDIYLRNETLDRYDKYNDLSKEYDNLEKEYNLLKTNYILELDKLKRELKEKENKITTYLKRGKLNNFCERDYRRKKREIKKLEILYEDLKKENHELKERINNYSKIIKEKERSSFDNNFNEIRNSIKGKNKIKFFNAMDKLRYDLDEEIKKFFYIIIKEKEKQLEAYKEEEKMRVIKEKQQLSILINKYDKTLICQEKENKDLKTRLQELERKLD